MRIFSGTLEPQLDRRAMRSGLVVTITDNKARPREGKECPSRSVPPTAWLCEVPRACKMMLKLLGAGMRLFMIMVMLSIPAVMGLGRANFKSPPQRVTSLPSYQVLDQTITGSHGRDVSLMDLETGRLKTLSLPPGVGIDKASLSPWEEEGRRQIVGIGWNRLEDGSSSQYSDIGLVRMSLPDGGILDRLTSPDVVLPACPPCWIRGAPAGVLYVGRDFRLYRVDFEPSHPSGGLQGPAEIRPSLVDWQGPLPGKGGVQFRDLSWPDEPRMGGRAFASLRFKDRQTGRDTDWQIWWLQFDRGGTSIAAAGQLLQTNLAEAVDSRKLPNLVSARGEPALIYLMHRPGEPGDRLWVAPIHFDPDSDSPLAEEADSRLLAEGLPPNSPVAFKNGWWITVMRKGGPDPKTERLAIPGCLGPDLRNSDRLFGCRVLRPVCLGRANPEDSLSQFASPPT